MMHKEEVKSNLLSYRIYKKGAIIRSGPVGHVVACTIYHRPKETAVEVPV